MHPLFILASYDVRHCGVSIPKNPRLGMLMQNYTEKQGREGLLEDSPHRQRRGQERQGAVTF